MNDEAERRVDPMAHDTNSVSDLDMRDGALGKLGALTVRLVRSDAELDAALALRFSIFHDEFGACRDPISLATKRDRDAYDAHCDHLIVIDETLDGPVTSQIVGTYRLLPHDKAQTLGFYSAQEFSINALLARHQHRRFLELGRSCVLPPYRGRRTIELLWQGIWAYCLVHEINTMVGCASFP
ncbi:MAG: GNAT family N-acyltransferase, partial [Pseudomonadota bacterium]